MANALTDARLELEAGARALGLSLDDVQLDRLLAYQGLLAKWNRVYNLTAIRDAGDMLTHHLLDSLSAVSRIAELARRAQPMRRACWTSAPVAACPVSRSPSPSRM